jgi:hypothetical protein
MKQFLLFFGGVVFAMALAIFAAVSTSIKKTSKPGQLNGFFS